MNLGVEIFTIIIFFTALLYHQQKAQLTKGVCSSKTKTLYFQIKKYIFRINIQEKRK